MLGKHYNNLYSFSETCTMPIRILRVGTSLVVKRLRLSTSTAAGLGSISAEGTKISPASCITWPNRKMKTKIKKKKTQTLKTKKGSKELTDHHPLINLFHFLHNLEKSLLFQVTLDISLGNL